jgi:hypothetical protein
MRGGWFPPTFPPTLERLGDGARCGYRSGRRHSPGCLTIRPSMGGWSTRPLPPAVGYVPPAAPSSQIAERQAV